MVWTPSPTTLSRHPLRGGDELTIDHQQTMVEAFDEALDEDPAAVFPGLFEGRAGRRRRP